MPRLSLYIAAAALALSASGAGAAPFAIDTGNPANGLTDFYSTTFEGPLSPCTGSSPTYCALFSGEPGSPARIVAITPSPSGVVAAVPLGITPVPASGSFLNLTLNGSNSQLTLTGGTISFPSLNLAILLNTGPTFAVASGAGMVFDGAPQTAVVNAQGQAEFLVDRFPATVVDFSQPGTIFGPPNGACSGPFCPLIPFLTLDMVRYRLFLDFDPTFTSFTGDFIGQTGNNSLIYATLNSAPPVPVPAAVWLMASGLGLLGAMRRKSQAA